MKYFFDVWKKYAVFSGRARRAEFWYFRLFNVIAIVIIGLVEFLFIQMFGQSAVMPFTIILCLYSIAVLVPSFAVLVRRLHDTQHSGWYMFISLIPLVGAILLLIVECTAGTDGPNRFGEDPKRETLITGTV